MRVSLRVNGADAAADCWEGESLLFALREKLGYPGSKNACEQGECGSCSVLLDGVLVCSCLVLAAQADGHDVTTVEGLASPDEDAAASGTAGVRRDRRRAVRLLHTGARRRGGRSARALSRSLRRRDPRGALGQPLPLHRLREDLRRGAAWPQRTALDESLRHFCEGQVACAPPADDDPGGRWAATPHPGRGNNLCTGDGCSHDDHSAAQARARPHRRDDRSRRRHPEGQRRVRLLERPGRAGDALGPHRPQPARSRARHGDRHCRGGDDGRRARGADARGRPRRKALRARVPRSAGARDRPRSRTPARPSCSLPPDHPEQARRAAENVRVDHEPPPAGHRHGAGDRAAGAPP